MNKLLLLLIVITLTSCGKPSQYKVCKTTEGLYVLEDTGENDGQAAWNAILQCELLREQIKEKDGGD